MTDTWDTSDWFQFARTRSTTAVAESLKMISYAGWGERSFAIADAQENTQLEVGFVPIEAHDLAREGGTLWDACFNEDDITRAMTVPAPGWYIVTVNSDGVPTGYEYATRAEALKDYDALRARF